MKQSFKFYELTKTKQMKQHYGLIPICLKKMARLPVGRISL